ncbi:MAG: membrane protein, partial [Chitinophagaceae bacterium]
MKKTILQILLLLLASPLFAQTTHILGDTASVRFAVLPNQGYALGQLLKDSKLHFKETDSLIGAQEYWLKIIVKNPEANVGEYILSVFPNKHTTLYSYDRERRHWAIHSNSLKNENYNGFYGRHPFHIDGLSSDTLFVKLDASGENIVNDRFKARVSFIKQETAEKAQQSIKIAWMLGMVVLLIFFFNNLFVYFGIKEPPLIYYLIMQFGAMLYISSYWNLLFKKPMIFSHLLGNEVYYYSITKLFNHLAILIIFFGLIKLTRSYLKTELHLPLEDRMLKYAFDAYFVFSIISATINMAGYYVDLYLWTYDNIFCAILVSMVIYTSIKAYIKKLPLAEPYLLANLLPLSFTLCIPLYHLLVTGDYTANFLLPVCAVVGQALGFSVALVTRTRAVQETLKIKEIEGRQLEFDMKEMAYINKLNTLEMAEMSATMTLEKTRSEHLQQRLELNQRELASSALNMVQKSEMLASLR